MQAGPGEAGSIVGRLRAEGLSMPHPTGRSKPRPDRFKSRWQLRLAGDAQVGCGACDPDVEKAMKQFGNPLR